MGGLLKSLMWSSALSRGAADMTQALRRASRRAALALVGGLLALVGAGFLLAAAFMSLAIHLDPIAAGVIVGTTLLLIGATVLLSTRRPARATRTTPSADGIAPMSARDLGRELSTAAVRNPALFVAAGFVTGLILGRRRR